MRVSRSVQLFILLTFFADAQENKKKSSFARYIEYAETPHIRPSYFSVPYRVPPGNKLRFLSNEMFAHLIREHMRHQQRLRNRPTEEPILQGVSRITELRQTPYRRFSHNSTATNYEQKRRQWKAEWKERMRANKSPPRQLGSTGGNGRYYITFNAAANAYQVSRRPPNYATSRQFFKEIEPDPLLPTVSTTTTTTTTTTTPETITVVQKADTLDVASASEFTVVAAPKSPPWKSRVKQLLNLDYYDDEFDELEESEETTTTTPIPTTTTTRRQPSTTTTTTTPKPTTTQIPPTAATYKTPIVYPPTETSATVRSSLFASYEDEEAEEDDEFTWFKPETRKPIEFPTEDPFRIIVHESG